MALLPSCFNVPSRLKTKVYFLKLVKVLYCVSYKIGSLCYCRGVIIIHVNDPRVRHVYTSIVSVSLAFKFMFVGR